MTILFLILGASLGSFLGVIIDNKFKVPSLKQRSKCKSCQKTIGLLSLIPILSFLIQRGKCRMCPSQIPRYLFALELANLFLFGLVLSWQYTLAPSLILFAFVSLNLLMGIFDYKNLSIKNSYLILNFLICLALAISLSIPMLHMVYGAIIGFSLFLFLWIITKTKGVGIGDAYILGAYGIVLGPGLTILNFFLAYWLAAIHLGLILIFKGKAKLPKAFGLIPYLSLGFLLSLKYGKFLTSLILYS